MNKRDYRQLAEAGAQQRLAVIEKELNDLQRAFPNIFVSDERPLLLKAALRDESVNGNRSTARYTAAWTPERRAAQAARMRKRAKDRIYHQKYRQRKQHAAQGTNKHKGKARWRERWYARLKKHGPEQVGVSAHALKTQSANLLTSATGWLKAGVIVKEGKGRYAVGAVAPS